MKLSAIPANTVVLSENLQKCSPFSKPTTEEVFEVSNKWSVVYSNPELELMVLGFSNEASKGEIFLQWEHFPQCEADEKIKDSLMEGEIVFVDPSNGLLHRVQVLNWSICRNPHTVERQRTFPKINPEEFFGFLLKSLTLVNCEI